MHHGTRATADRLVEMLAAEYPRLTLEAVPGDKVDHELNRNELFGFEVPVDEGDVNVEGTKVPEQADILDACSDRASIRRRRMRRTRKSARPSGSPEK